VCEGVVSVPDAKNGEVSRDLRTLFNVGTVAGLNDRELLERFTARSDEAAEFAFAAIVERHGPMVLRVCKQVLRHPQDAEDAFQVTFMVLARRANSVRLPEEIGPFLYGVALRVAACARAKEGRRKHHEKCYGSMQSASYRSDDLGELAQIMHEELDRLPNRFRSVIVLCDLEGETSAEAARRLGCPHGTVMSRLAEARRQLSRRLVRRGLGPLSGDSVAFFANHMRGLSGGLPPILGKTTSHAAALFATNPAALDGSVPASTAVLTRGVLAMMAMTKVKTIAAMLAVGFLAIGGVIFAQGLGSGQGRSESDRLRQVEEQLGRLIRSLDNKPDPVQSRDRPKVMPEVDLPKEHELADGKWVKIATDPIAPKMVLATGVDPKKRVITLFEVLNLPGRTDKAQYSEVTEFSLESGRVVSADGQPIGEPELWQRLAHSEDKPPTVVLVARDERALAPMFRNVLRPGTILLIGKTTYRGTDSQ
jgi:RNA polymerase sigma factor (sigma-70 family)